MLCAARISQLFILFQQGDKKLIAQLKQLNPNAIVNNQWYFQLTQLCQLYQSFYQLHTLDYKEFRTFIFNAPINHQLKAHHLCIKIAKAQAHVDNNLYFLTTST